MSQRIKSKRRSRTRRSCSRGRRLDGRCKKKPGPKRRSRTRRIRSCNKFRVRLNIQKAVDDAFNLTLAQQQKSPEVSPNTKKKESAENARREGYEQEESEIQEGKDRYEPKQRHNYHLYYNAWLNTQWNCVGKMLNGLCKINRPFYVLGKFNTYSFAFMIEASIGKIIEDGHHTPIFTQIIYKTPFHHVAGILVRWNDDKILIEYVDSMARPPSHDTFQRELENKLKEYSPEYIVNNEPIYIIVNTSVDMYNGLTSKGEFTWQPPQNDENEFIATIKDEHLLKKITDKLLLRHIEFVGEYDGGDCEFWCAFIVKQMIQKNITNKQWMKNFRNTLGLTGEGYDSDTSNNFGDGAKITVFITKKILKYAIQCAKEQLRPIPDTS